MPDNRRDPAGLHADIDRTREELANTVDEIVYRVHPSRVARRGTDRVKEIAGSTFGPGSPLGDSLTFVRREEVPELPEGEQQGYEQGEVASYTIRHRLRKGPVLVLAGVAAAGTVAIVLWRRSRR